MTWSLSASGHVPASTDPAKPDPDALTVETEFYTALRAIFTDPKYGAQASTFSGQHVSGSLHLPDEPGT